MTLCVSVARFRILKESLGSLCRCISVLLRNSRTYVDNCLPSLNSHTLQIAIHRQLAELHAELLIHQNTEIG